jgi:hypothetical protein
MVKRAKPTAAAERTAYFIVYDARSGDILAVHHVTALPGVRVPSDALVQRRVLACAADALDRSAADLRLLATPEAQTISPGLRIDVSTGKLSAPQRQHKSARGAKTDGGSAPDQVAKFRSP